MLRPCWSKSCSASRSCKSKLEQVIEDSLGHHVCRCTGYVRYYNATRNVLTDLGLVKEG